MCNQTMCESLLYTALTTDTAVANGGIMPLGDTIIKRGCSVMQNGNTIKTFGKGVFFVSATATIAAASAAPITFSLQQDGVEVTGGQSTITVAGTSDETVLPINVPVQNLTCCGSTLSFVVSGADVTVDNLAVTVFKV